MRHAVEYLRRSTSSGSSDAVLSQGWAEVDISIHRTWLLKTKIWRQMAYRSALAAVHAGPAGLQFAVLALEDKPVRAGMADIAQPLDQTRFRLDQLE